MPSSLADLPDPAKSKLVAEVLGVSERTLNEWRRNGSLPAAKIAGIWYYRKATLEAALTPKASS